MQTRLGSLTLPPSYDEMLKFNLHEFLRVIQVYGQLLIYEQAVRCPCYNEDSGQPDFRCPVCGSHSKDSLKGWIYQIPRYVKVDERSNEDGCVAPFTNEFTIPVRHDQIRKVFSATNCKTGEIYKITGFSGKLITIDGSKPLTPFDVTQVSYEYDAQQIITNELITINPEINKQWTINTTHGTIRKVNRVENITRGEIYTVRSFGYNSIVIEGENIPSIDDEIRADYEYIPPITGLVTGVNVNIRLLPIGELRMGDAMLSVHPSIKLGFMDRITLLSQEEKESEILTREKKDRLRYKEIINILNVLSLGKDGATETFYEEGVDFLLKGSEINWIGKAPLPQRQYSVTYNFKPVYRIYTTLPTVRTPANEMMPRRAILRRDDTW